MVELKENKNLLFLWIEGLLKGAILYMENDEPKKVKEILNYDSITHTFRLKFTDGDILVLSDKDRYFCKVRKPNIQIDVKPNKKRKKFKRWR